VKKGQALGRQAYYQTFEVAKVHYYLHHREDITKQFFQVQEDSKECQKRNVDWREVIARDCISP
jgi:hypothetical protein